VLLNRPLVDLAARRADAIITVSESAKRDIVSYYRLDPKRVHVVYEAAAPSFKRVEDPEELDRVRKRYGLDERIILYVGTIEPRKNLPRIAAAVDGELRVVGAPGWGNVEPPDNVNRLGQVGDEELASLYRGARCLVYPSLYEGFGLPILEGMASGVPVVTSRGGATEEIAGGAAVLVDPHDPASIAAGIDEAGRRRESLVPIGLARASMFTWRRSADLVEDLWRELA